MLKEKCPIKARELIIVFIVAIAGLILGGSFDLDLSKKVVDVSNPNIFGMIMAGLAALPITFALAYGGFSIILNHPSHKVWKVLFIGGGVIAVLCAIYFTYDNIQAIETSLVDKSKATMVKIIGIIFALLFVAATCLLVFKTYKKFDRRNLFLISCFLVFISAASAGNIEATKWIWSRPRPYYVLQQADPSSAFHPFWVLDPFRCAKAKPEGFGSDAFKSFASGHTSASSLLMFVLPMLTLLSPKYKDNRKLQVVLFYIGFGWAIVSALSRILLGMHYISDVSAGLFFGTFTGTVFTILIFKIKSNRPFTVKNGTN